MSSNLKYIKLTDNTLTGTLNSNVTRIAFDTSGNPPNIAFQYSTTTLGYEIIPNPNDSGILQYRYSATSTNTILQNDSNGNMAMYTSSLTAKNISVGDLNITIKNGIGNAMSLYSQPLGAGYLAINDNTSEPRIAAYLSQITTKPTIELLSAPLTVGTYIDDTKLNTTKVYLNSLVFSDEPLKMSDISGIGVVTMKNISGIKQLYIDDIPIGGTAGTTGPFGPTGPRGIPGIATNTGATGPTGEQGDPGLPGSATNTGATGPTGQQQFTFNYKLVKSTDLNTGRMSVIQDTNDSLFKRLITTINFSNIDNGNTETTSYFKYMPLGSHLHILDRYRDETSIYLIENAVFFERTPCQWQFDVRYLSGPSSVFTLDNVYNIYFNIAGPPSSGNMSDQLNLKWGLTLEVKYLTLDLQETGGPYNLNPDPSGVNIKFGDYICYPGSLLTDVSGAAIWITGLNCGVGLPKYVIVNSWESLANFPDYPPGNEGYVQCIITPPANLFKIGFESTNNRLIIYKTSMDIFNIDPQDIDIAAGYPTTNPHVTISMYW